MRITIFHLTCLSLFVFGCTSGPRNGPEGDTTYKDLHLNWLDSAIEHKPNVDPRADTDQLRPLRVYDGDLILKKNINRQGEGWQLSGGLIDMAEGESERYLLYGLTSQFFEAGLYNNSPDLSRTLYEYIVVRESGQEKDVVIVKQPHMGVSQILLGLRRTEGGCSVLQLMPSGTDTVVWRSSDQ